jgi:hypothetical protein
MKNKTTLILLLVLLRVAAVAQTNVSGFISANTNWTLAGSPYIVVSNALLSHGYTLTIDPGVTVKFNDSCALQIDGELIAIGTAQSRITFTSNKLVPAAGDWAKIHFADTSVSAVFDTSGNYISGSIMKYCDVMYGGALGYGQIHIENSSPYFSNCNIANSMADGIYSHGTAFILDSSLVNNCMGYGLSFHGAQINSCGLTIIGDSINNNKQGGIIIDGAPGCNTVINNNYFVGNSFRGAIYSTYPFNNILMTGNHFISDSCSFSQTGIVSFIQGSNHNISENYFENNFVSSGYGVLHDFVTGNCRIECNLFLNNQITASNIPTLLIIAHSGTTEIRNNIFDGNSNSNALGIAVAKILVHMPANAYFTNNVIRNNISLSNTCCQFVPDLQTINPILFINNNIFQNNISQSVVYIDGSPVSSSNYDFLYMKHNNFDDPNSTYELYNNILYGSPNLYPDSNYWGGTSTAHVDSVIYDYFDFANQSVVYYMPILTTTLEIDTTCSLIATGIKEINPPIALSSSIFPNPFTTQATIRFNKAVHNATLKLFNLLSEQVRSEEHFSGNEILLLRKNLQEGIYFYEVVEKQERVCSGKAIVM